MTKVRTTLTVDAEVLRAVKVRAARPGKGDSEVIEEAIRRDLGLELLDRLWAANRLDVEKEVLGAFVRKRVNDRIGLVAFAARPYIAAPPTLPDRSASASASSSMMPPRAQLMRRTPSFIRAIFPSW